MQSIKYKAVYGRIYIFFGILFTVVFIAGGIILDDPINYAYAIASLFMIQIGWNVLKKPYAEFDQKTIILYSFLGKIREKYEFSSNKELKLIKNRIYLNNKKLKMNSWFLATNDWKRILAFYELADSELDDELIEDSSSL
jgi:hypothetical protein